MCWRDMSESWLGSILRVGDAEWHIVHRNSCYEIILVAWYLLREIALLWYQFTPHFFYTDKDNFVVKKHEKREKAIELLTSSKNVFIVVKRSVVAKQMYTYNVLLFCPSIWSALGNIDRCALQQWLVTMSKKKTSGIDTVGIVIYVYFRVEVFSIIDQF